MKKQSEENKSFDKLWKHCISNNRLCPNPPQWSEFYFLLKDKNNSKGGELSAPLILTAWHHTMPLEKRLRLKEHIQWAVDNNIEEEAEEYLKSLSEDDWAHFGEV